MTKKKEKILHEAHKKYFQLILGDLSLEQIHEIIADDVSGYGTTKDEKILEIDRLRKMVINQREQGEGIEISFDVKPVNLRVSPDKDMAIFNDEVKIVMQDGGEENVINLRLSTVYEFLNNKWKVVHLHGSTAVETEDDTWHLNEWKRKSEELQKLVDEKTADLAYKNRELEIEASLERIRAIAMGMQKAEGLLDVVEILSIELKKLGFTDIRNTIINIFNDTQEKFLNYDYSDYGVGGISEVDYNSHPSNKEFVDKMREASEDFMITEFTGKELDEWRKWRIDQGQMPDTKLDQAESLFYYEFSIGVGSIGVSTFSPIDADQLKILNKIRNVFDLAYRRYVDIEQAEAHAREAQIEAALERVRAASMAMHKSEQLPETAAVMFQQLCSLGQVPDRLGINIYNEQQQTFESWTTDQSGMQLTKAFNASNKEPTTFSKIYKAWKENKDIITIDLTGQDLKNWLRFVKEKMKLPIKESNIKNRRVHYNAFFSHGCIMCTFHKPTEHNFNQLLVRFAKVFDQTYTRFLDLQKAEAQAREAQIELGLERVRARAMAMQNSNELSQLVDTVFIELTNLDFALTLAIINIIDEDSMSNTVWAKNPDISKAPESYYMKFEDYPFHHGMFKAWKERKTKWVYKMKGKEKSSYDDYLFNETEFRRFPDAAKEGMRQTKQYVASFTFSNFGGLQTVGEEDLSDDNLDILARFGKVFDLTYTRFNDLQKAEAQAREAQIEASLEKVRSRSIGMQKSEELKEVIQVIHDQLIHLNFKIDAAGFTMDYFQNNDWNIWIANTEQSLPSKIYIPYIDHPQFNYYKGAKEKGLDFFANTLSFEDKNSIFNYMFEFMGDYPQAEKDQVLNAPGLAISQAFLKNITLWIYNLDGNPYTEEDNDILMRFARVFEQTYVRFNDLQKAEKQARESQIETALERVRSRSLAMHKPEELKEVVGVIAEKLQELDVIIDAGGVIICTYFPDNKDVIHWIAETDFSNSGKYLIPYFNDLTFNDAWDSKESGEAFFTKTYNKEEKNNFFNYAFEHTGYKNLPDDFKQFVLKSEKIVLSFAWAKNSAIMLPSHTGIVPSEDHIEILKRFAKVFEQAYIRFLDLQKAEEQVREAQIEAALERVRSKTMAMHNSDDMADTVVTLFEEVLRLGLDDDIRCGIGILEGTVRMETRSATLDLTGEVDLKIGMLDMTIHPLLKRIKNGWERGETHYVDQMSGKDVVKYYSALNNEPDYPFLRDLNTLPKIEYHNSFSFPEGIIFAFSPNPMSEEAAQVFERFARVFGQTYRRYRDLLKAEEQARESQIEAALERVRSKAMAMHSSEDLGLTVDTFFAELKGLNVSPHRCGLGIIDKETKIVNVQAIDTNGGKHIKKVVGDLKLSGHPVLNKIFENWQLQKEYFPVLRGKEIMEYYNVMNPQVKFHEFAEDEVQYGYYFYFKEGGVYAWTDSELPERDLQIFRRYSSVLSLTYRRYLDLKEAEAQAREAKIEASLERIRSRALSMQKSTEVGAVNDVLFDEFEKMGIEMVGCGISVINEDTDQCEQWRASQVAAVNSFEPYSYKESVRVLSKYVPVFMRKFQHAWKKDEPFLNRFIKGKERDAYLEAVATLFNYSKKQRKEILASFPKSFMVNFIFYKRGWLSLSTIKPLTEYEINFSRRFVEAFDFAHTRFLDLQKAELQAKEAVKQASIDRVRAQIASMRSTEDLQRITPLIWQELETLEVPFSRCGVFIIDELLSQVRVYLTTPDGKPLGVLNLPTDANSLTKATIKHWKKKTVYTLHWNKSDFVNWMQSMIELGQIQNTKEYQGNVPPPKTLDLNFIPFTQGMLYVGNIEPLSTDKIDLVKSLAKAFSVAYARYEDFKQLEDAKNKIENTFNDLKATQTQLVHAEKMASLGELTAGIAHEIQNPLNFVNNFSEVNSELIEELKEEVDNKNLEEVIAIANDIADNEQKIHHHGKRADAIVKGMLQHSRTTSNEKEPTDINLLADEYLRLSYHGLRAKDKSFNADFKTNLDNSLPKIKVIPQDIGRVLLNLINNAFYAVSEASAKETAASSKSSASKEREYKPIVIVSTRNLGDKIEIIVKDNGNGIPEKIKEKIFQPFFTTKPTGEGTGLGLSLSYDIITKGHGGELKVETKENEGLPAGQAGTEFIIQIPINE